MTTKTIGRRIRHMTPINPSKLRRLQETEALHFGYSLGGAYRERRADWSR